MRESIFLTPSSSRISHNPFAVSIVIERRHDRIFAMTIGPLASRQRMGFGLTGRRRHTRAVTFRRAVPLRRKETSRTTFIAFRLPTVWSTPNKTLIFVPLSPNLIPWIRYQSPLILLSLSAGMTLCRCLHGTLCDECSIFYMYLFLSPPPPPRLSFSLCLCIFFSPSLPCPILALLCPGVSTLLYLHQ